MKFEQNVNTLVNEIMSNRAAAAMLFAPAGSGKADFLSELASRYSHVFWFDASVYDLQLLPYFLIDRIITDDEDLRLKLGQLMYCRSDFNSPGVVICAILDCVAKVKGNYLFIFEHVEKVQDKGSLEYLEQMMKLCPQNLKIVVSSDCFINFNYSRFEPMYPKLIDETSLQMPSPLAPAAYLSELTREDIGFLIYVSALPSVDVGFVREVYADGERILRYLSRKRFYVAQRDQNSFRLNGILREYLKSVEKDYRDVLCSWDEISVLERCGDYMYRNKRNLSAFMYYQSSGCLPKCDRAIGALLSQKDSKQLYAIFDCLRTSVGRVNLPTDDTITDFPYYRIYVGLCRFVSGEKEQAAKTIGEMVEFFRGKDTRSFFQCVSYYARILLSADKKQEAADFILKIISDFESTYPEYVDILQCAMVSVAKEMNLSLADFEKKIASPDKVKQFWYLKTMEDLAKSYLRAGNYRKAVELTDAMKEYMPYYVVPNDLLTFRYYLGEVEICSKRAEDALEFAFRNGIKKDISLIYMVLATIDLHYGKIHDGLKKADMAVEADEAEGENKDVNHWLTNIGKRCVLYARYRDPNYAREVAHIYLKYCETYAPQCADMILLALSYSYHMLGDKEKSYFYAMKCMSCSKQRTAAWLTATAIVAGYRLNKSDLKDAATLVRNIMKHADNYGMLMVVVDYFSGIFDTLIEYAKHENIEPEFVREVEDIIYRKQHIRKENSDLKVNMFGDVSISVAGKEIQWKTRKSKDLFLHYLLAGEGGIDRNVIIDILWKDYLYESAINNLKTTNNLIRKTLMAYQVEFKLEYINSKYSLSIPKISSDLKEYHRLIAKYNRETEAVRMCETMDSILELYHNEFAADVNYQAFNDERRSIRQEMVIGLLRLVRLLARQDEFMLAKKYLSALTVVDKMGDYSHMVAELDAHINITD